MVKASDFGIVTTALPSREEARRIAGLLLEEKLAACVQLLEIESHYVWKGKTMAEPEILLLAKTRTSLFERAVARIKSAHPYETPEIVAEAFAAGFAPYFSWIETETG